jgi:hypothetical protein
MQKSEILIKDTFEKYKRACNIFEIFLKKEVLRFKDNMLPEQILELASDTDFKELRGLLYSFFDNNNILISVSPYDKIVNVSSNTETYKWQYHINLEGTDIIEGNFDKREYAEFIAFKQSFQFLDTQLFIKLTSNRFYDESSDSSCLKVDWNHLKNVLNYRRENLISELNYKPKKIETQ